jgi:outer membrane protein TolC
VQSQSLQAEHAVSLVNQQLLQLLGNESNITIEPSDSLMLIDLNIESVQSMQMGDQRADLLAMERAVRAGELNKRSQQLGFVPRVNAFGSYGFNDTEIFGTEADNYLVGVQLKWDLFQGGKQIGSVQRAKHESELAELALQEKQAAAKREIIRLKNDLLLAKEHVALSDLAAKQAKEMYAIRTDRFAEGLEKTSDLLLAETNYLNKQLGALQAKNHYLQTLFKLETELAQNLTSFNN